MYKVVVEAKESAQGPNLAVENEEVNTMEAVLKLVNIFSDHYLTGNIYTIKISYVGR